MGVGLRYRTVRYHSPMGNEQIIWFIAGRRLEIQHSKEKSCRQAVCTAKEGAVKVHNFIGLLCLLSANLVAQTKGPSPQFPSYMGDGFDYATFTRFDATAPPKSLIYQSNGFMALQESGFGGQRVIVPVAGPTAPVNEGERLEALDIAAPMFVDESGQSFSLSDNSAKHSLTYFADRTVYRATFDNGVASLADGLSRLWKAGGRFADRYCVRAQTSSRDGPTSRTRLSNCSRFAVELADLWRLEVALPPDSCSRFAGCH